MIKLKISRKEIFFDQEKYFFIVNGDTIKLSTSLLEPYVSQTIHDFNPIFEFPLSYWNAIPDLGRFNIRFPDNVVFKAIELDSKPFGYTVTIFNHKGINYGIITHDYVIDNSNCSNDRYLSTSVYPRIYDNLVANSNLLQILKDNRVDPRMILMKID